MTSYERAQYDNWVKDTIENDGVIAADTAIEIMTEGGDMRLVERLAHRHSN